MHSIVPCRPAEQHRAVGRARSILSAVMSTTAAETALVSWEGEAAWKNALGGAHSRGCVERRSRQWPLTAASRLESAFVLPDVRPSFHLSADDSIFAIGSCFARNAD